ncbi:MAG: hypothetical protein NTZ08_01000, partial [Verrucomicrobia bacterium]|nr:hypothetical protein [Verrucomicrobiota bacterium]
VTLNAAYATATGDVLGQLKPGYVADVAVFIGAKDRTDYASVVRGNVEDVALVLRGGLPLSGDQLVLEALGQGDAAKCEVLDVCGVSKRVCVERETGRKLADLETAAKPPIYQLFACGVPTKEPTCVPYRRDEFTGMATAADPDGDGRKGKESNEVGAYTLPHPKAGKRCNNQNKTKPRRRWRRQWFLIDGMHKNDHCRGKNQQAMTPVPAAFGDVQKLLERRFGNFSIALGIRD